MASNHLHHQFNSYMSNSIHTLIISTFNNLSIHATILITYEPKKTPFNARRWSLLECNPHPSVPITSSNSHCRPSNPSLPCFGNGFSHCLPQASVSYTLSLSYLCYVEAFHHQTVSPHQVVSHHEHRHPTSLHVTAVWRR